MKAYYVTYSVYTMQVKNIMILNFFSIPLIKLPNANNNLIQVWIESIKVDGQWQFHDGSPMRYQNERRTGRSACPSL